MGALVAKIRYTLHDLDLDFEFGLGFACDCNLLGVADEDADENADANLRGLGFVSFTDRNVLDRVVISF